MATDYSVTLELPECEGDDPVAAVFDFINQAQQKFLWTYRVTDNSTGERFLVDLARGEGNEIVPRDSYKED